MPQLRVSENKRYLEYEDGTPFFYLGDTAWQLFHSLSQDEADLYLENRAAKGFTVVQAVAVPARDDPHVPEDAWTLIDNDPAQPNPAFFGHVDAIVDKAASLGLFIGMLPTWGNRWQDQGSEQPPIFNVENARVYGRFLGARYRDADHLDPGRGSEHRERARTRGHRGDGRRAARGGWRGAT